MTRNRPDKTTRAVSPRTRKSSTPAPESKTAPTTPTAATTSTAPITPTAATAVVPAGNRGWPWLLTVMMLVAVAATTLLALAIARGSTTTTASASGSTATTARGSTTAGASPQMAWMAPGLPMVERLAAIRAAVVADPMRNPFANSEQAAYMLASPPPEDIPSRREYELALAFNLLNSGQTKEAIEQLEMITTGLSQAENPTPGLLEEMQMQLGIAWLRHGEQTNCIRRHTADACLLPIRGEGVHLDTEGSQRAVDMFSQVLQRFPNDLTVRWLLNLAYMTMGEYPSEVPERFLIPEVTFASDYDIGRFPDIAPDVGLDVFGNAGGSIMDDFDGDQDLDVVFSSMSLTGQLRYFLNDGDGTFTERTHEAGLDGLVGGLNVIQADYNNDGWLDLFVPRGAWLGNAGKYPNSLLRNNGDGTFTDVTEAAGMLSFHPTQVGAWGDFDGDGWLDLFVGNEMEDTAPHPSELYHNNRDGTFTDIAPSMEFVKGFVKGATWGDYNNDGWIDLYVSRHGDPNSLYRNNGAQADGSWSFTDVTTEAGVAEPIESFSTWFFDYNNDGWEDLYVADFGQPKMGRTTEYVASLLGLPTEGNHPFLYRNNGDGTFSDVSTETGLARPTFTMGSNFGDLDNDGWLDFYLATGDPLFQSLIPNRMFRNDGGRRFQEVTTSGGFGHLQKGHGIAFGDIDNDGDQDVLDNQGGAYTGDGYQKALYLNPGHGNHWVTLLLEGVEANRAAIGARLKVTLATAAGPRDIYATAGNGSSFGGNSLRQEIGLGDAERIERVEVTWPGSGQVQTFDGLALDRGYRLREGAPSAEPLELRPADAPVDALTGAELTTATATPRP